jgi:hypothetical protein
MNVVRYIASPNMLNALLSQHDLSGRTEYYPGTQE